MPVGSTRPAAEFGVYLHIPFCVRRCDYCAFATWTDRDHLVAEYVAACHHEIRASRDSGRLRPATTVFVGGGTPSLLAPGLLAGLIEAIEVLPDAEITVECNPESTTPELLASLAAVGVTRISLGVQSMAPHVLTGLGRHAVHGALESAIAAIAATGFATYNVDLVYGGAGERPEDWEATLDGVLGLDPPPPHVSAYALTVEPGTALARDPSRHPDDDVQADRYAVADRRLGRSGRSWYEISNWALPGHECRHNLSCWAGGEYVGIGCAAHSHLAGTRSVNVRTPERYIAAIAEHASSATASSETLPPTERTLEHLALALRTRTGVPECFLEADPLLDRLVERRSGRAVLTLEGRLLANEVALRLRPSTEHESAFHHAP